MSSQCLSVHFVKGLWRWATRCFAEFTLSEANVLSMTGLDLSVHKELSRAFELCLTLRMRRSARATPVALPGALSQRSRWGSP
jgi:hypothetical protein